MRISDWSSDVCSSDLFGLDGKQAPGQIDFLNVVLHEIGHGLGFSGFGSLTTGAPLAGNDGVARADIYSTFVYDNTQNKSWYAQIGRASCRERVCQYV